MIVFVRTFTLLNIGIASNIRPCDVDWYYCVTFHTNMSDVELVIYDHKCMNIIDVLFYVTVHKVGCCTSHIGGLYFTFHQINMSPAESVH